MPQGEGVNLPFELEGHYVTESGAGQSQAPINLLEGEEHFHSHQPASCHSTQPLQPDRLDESIEPLTYLLDRSSLYLRFDHKFLSM